LNREIAEEVESHIEEKVADLMEAGISERESRQKASRDFGNANTILDIKTLAAQVDDSLVQERMISTLAGFFSLSALLLAIVVLYGIMAYSVTRRTSEIGMALGAERRDVLWFVLRDTMALVMTGVAVGVPAALAAGRLAGHLVSGLLFGLTATDPVTIAIAALLLACGAAVAGYLPARRASRVDPMLALRYK
jgi:ABC-type antimicrobial peptide transport system permease subunit